MISSSASSESWLAVFSLPQQVEIGVVEHRAEQLAQLVVGDAGLNQFEQNPLVLLLADDQPAKAQQVAHQQHAFLVPRLRHETGGPHRQRAAGVLHAVVDAFAVGGELVERLVVQIGHFLVEVQIQPGAAEEAIHLHQLGLVGDQLGRVPAGHRAGKEHLRGPIDGVHVAQPIEGGAPRAGRDMRHAMAVASDA